MEGDPQREKQKEQKGGVERYRKRHRASEPKVKRVLRKKIGLDGKLRAEEIIVMVSVNDCAERKLAKQYEGLNVEWAAVEAQLVA